MRACNALAAVIVVISVAIAPSQIRAAEIIWPGTNYSAARKLLLSKGYAPLQLSKQRCLDNVSGRNAVCETYSETAFCAGTGFANCQFAFNAPNGELLLVETEGEEQNVAGKAIGLDLGVKRSRIASPVERQQLLDSATRGNAKELWAARPNLMILLASEGRVQPFTSRYFFELNYPVDTCNLSLEDGGNSTQRLHYDCPAYYEGVPMSFTFTTNYKMRDLILTRVESNGKPLDAAAISLLSEDVSLDGFGSFQKLFDAAQPWDVSVHTDNGLTIQGKFSTMINHLTDTGYHCVLGAQMLPEFLVRCTYYNTYTKEFNNDDRWYFKFSKINEKEVVLTNAASQLLDKEISGPKISEFADTIFKPSAGDGPSRKEFYNKPIDKSWYVGGVVKSDSNSECYAHLDIKDGSSYELVRDLVDSELYLRIRNMSWNLQRGADDKLNLRLNIQRGKSVIDGADFGWSILNKNTIVIPRIHATSFMDALWKGDIISVIMPGDTQSTAMYFEKPRDLIRAMAECVKKFEPFDKPPALGPEDPSPKGLKR
jgi:hypothetical protein